jgi:hypothetical protein
MDQSVGDDEMHPSELAERAAYESVLRAPTSAAIPARLSRLAEGVAAARHDGTPEELRGEDSAMAMFRGVRRPQSALRWRRRAFAGAATVALGLGGGAGLAAAGNLPGPLQRTAASALGAIGITIPHAEDEGTRPAPPSDATGSNSEATPAAGSNDHTGQDASQQPDVTVTEIGPDARQEDPSAPVGSAPSPASDHSDGPSGGPSVSQDSGSGAGGGTSSSSSGVGTTVPSDANSNGG